MKKLSEIKKLIVNENDHFNVALKSLNNSGKKICLVTNKKNKLIGVITDGDIRRNLLKKKRNLKCGLISSKNYLSSSSILLEEKLINKAKKKKILNIPVVNKNGMLIGIHFLTTDSFKKKLDVPLVIMAGGIGKRLRPYTLKKPKPLMNIGGNPLIDEIIKNAQNAGIKTIYISVNYMKNKIYNHIKKNNYSNLKINFLNETKPLGTAGSLKMLQKIKDDNFIITNGDVFTGLNYKEVLDKHIKQKNYITICAKEKIDQIKYGVIKFNKLGVTNINEKPVNKYFINAGIYVFKKKILRFIKKNQKIDMPDLIKKILNSKKRIGFHIIQEFWIDIGNKTDLNNAKNLLRNDK